MHPEDPPACHDVSGYRALLKPVSIQWDMALGHGIYSFLFSLSQPCNRTALGMAYE